MANLLPTDSLKNLRRIERARLLLVIALTILAAATVAFFALLPASIAFYYTSRAGPATGLRASTATREDLAAIQEIRGMVFALRPIVAATTTPTEAIVQALSVKPPAVAINTITYTAAGGSGTITLSGTSKVPSAINAYRVALSADPHFLSASVPISALIGVGNGQFTMTLTGVF